MQFPVTNPIKTLPPGGGAGCCWIQATQILSSYKWSCCTSTVTLQCAAGGCEWAISSWSGSALSLQLPTMSPVCVRQCEECHGNALALWSVADWHHWKRSTEVSEDRVWPFELKRHNTAVAHGLFCWHSKVQALFPHGSNCKWSSKDDPAISPL